MEWFEVTVYVDLSNFDRDQIDILPLFFNKVMLLLS